MRELQLFLNIDKPGLNNEWNKKISTLLKECTGIDQVLVIEKNESSEAQINLSFDVQKASLDAIELIVKNFGATIREINLHFPSGISGASDPYGSSAISLPLEEKLKTIYGVLSSGISSTGTIKIVLDTRLDNKQNTILEILKAISSLRSNNT